MGVKAQAPALTMRNSILGAGAIYFNYGEVSEACVGATKGGSKFTVEREIREVEQDGTYGPVKGSRRKSKIVPILTVNAMEINTTTIAKFYAGMAVSTANVNYDVVTENVAIASGDYLTNIAFVGETQDGEDIVVIVKNPLGDGNIDLAIADKEEIVPETQFTGHYAADALTTVPYEIRFPKAAGDTTAPTVTVSPVDAATNVVVSANVVWTFAEAIKLECIIAANFMLMKADGTAVVGALSYNAGQTVITFNPTADLTAGTAYLAIATTSIKDIAGNALAATNVSNFTTAS